MSNRPRQELCYQNEPGAGAKYMPLFDMLPPDIRKEVRNSSINICTACLVNLRGQYGGYLKTLRRFECAVAELENDRSK